MTTDEKRALVAESHIGRAMTLNAEPAVLSGAYLDCATVHQLAAPHLSAVFAWSTVARIMRDGCAEFDC